MIEGVKFDFSGKELKDHFEKRAERNNARAAAFEKEVARYKEDEDAPVSEENRTYSNKAIGSAKETLKERVKHYKRRAVFFTVSAAHVVVDETYRLNEHDMTSLEIVYES